MDSQRDGIAQITSALLRYNGVDGLHIVSHGGTGQVQLGSTWLSINNLDTYRNAISAWQYAMSDEAELLFYGCDLAASNAGQQLLNEISRLTDTEAAAMEDLQLRSENTAVDNLISVRHELVILDPGVQNSDELRNLLLAQQDAGRNSAIVSGSLTGAVESPTARHTEIAFVDSQVTDYQQLVADLQRQSGTDRQIEIVLLDLNRDGIRHRA